MRRRGLGTFFRRRAGEAGERVVEPSFGDGRSTPRRAERLATFEAAYFEELQ